MLRRMRWVWLAVALLAAGGAVRSASAATYVSGSFGSGDVNVSVFYQSLAPYGRWVDYNRYGWVWTPTRVASTWRPYSDGYWAYTDYGWTWVDNEPWGWGPMHYGRWTYDEDIGWVWVPGTTWAPAWVAWASYGDDIGWAPLPPDYGWNGGVSVSFTSFDVHRVPVTYWNFAPTAYLSSRDLSVRLMPPSRVQTFFPRVQNATHFSVRGGTPVNLGVDVRQVERTGGHPVMRLRLADVSNPSAAQSRPNGNVLPVFRQRLAAAPRNAAPPVSARMDAHNMRGPGNGNPSIDRRNVNANVDRGYGNANRRNPAPQGVQGVDNYFHGRGRGNNPTRDMPNASASASRNQQRQRFDIQQAQQQNNGQPRRGEYPRDMQQGRGGAPNPNVNRNQYPQGTYQQPPRGRGYGQGRPTPEPTQGNAPMRPVDRGNRGNGRGRGAQQQQPQQQPDQQQPQDQQQQDRSNGNGHGHGRGHGGD